VAFDKLAVPAQQRLRRHQPMAPTLGRQQPGQRREHDAVGPGGTWPGDRAAQDRDLVPKHEDLGVLGGLSAGEHYEPADELMEDQVEESERHDGDPCGPPPLMRSRRSTPQTGFSAPTRSAEPLNQISISVGSAAGQRRPQRRSGAIGAMVLATATGCVAAQRTHRSGGTNMAHLGNLYHSQTAFRQVFLPGPDPPSRSSLPTPRTRQDDTFG